MNESPRTHAPQSSEEERCNREAALDETIEASFPASDPPSTDPNPNDEEALNRHRRRSLPTRCSRI